MNIEKYDNDKITVLVVEDGDKIFVAKKRHRFRRWKTYEYVDKSRSRKAVKTTRLMSAMFDHLARITVAE